MGTFNFWLPSASQKCSCRTRVSPPAGILRRIGERFVRGLTLNAKAFADLSLACIAQDIIPSPGWRNPRPEVMIIRACSQASEASQGASYRIKPPWSALARHWTKADLVPLPPRNSASGSSPLQPQKSLVSNHFILKSALLKQNVASFESWVFLLVQ